MNSNNKTSIDPFAKKMTFLFYAVFIIGIILIGVLKELGMWIYLGFLCLCEVVAVGYLIMIRKKNPDADENNIDDNIIR